jgi:serine/threonine protein kinase
MYEKNNKYFAIKKLPKKKIINQNMSSQVRKEIQIMGDLNHPNIVKLYDVLED